MGFILNMADLAMLNQIKSAAQHSVYNNTVLKFLYYNIFIISRVDKASAADTVNMGSITGLVKYIQLPGYILAIKWTV